MISCPECSGQVAPSKSPGYLYCIRCGRGSIPRPKGYWLDSEIHAAAQRASEKLYPQGEGHWNRVEWLRVVMDELAKGEAGVSTTNENEEVKNPLVSTISKSCQSGYHMTCQQYEIDKGIEHGCECSCHITLASVYVKQ